jgi:hypothetical protein
MSGLAFGPQPASGRVVCRWYREEDSSLPQKAKYIEKRMNNHGRKETAATPPQFTGNKAECDSASDDDGAALRMADTE